jgi:hypothetical protein
MSVNSKLDNDLLKDGKRKVRVKRYKKRRHRVSQYDSEVERYLDKRDLRVLSGLLILSLAVVGIVIVMTMSDPPTLLERLSTAIERLPEAIEMLFE